MTYNAMASSSLGEYGRISRQTGIEHASPHRLIQVLMEAAIEKIVIAKGYMLRQQIAEKGKHIGWAVSIIEGLQMGLDTSVDHEITRNLEDLYSYMNRRLVLANVRNDVEILDEVVGLLKELKEAWDAIPEKLAESEDVVTN